jgi:cell division protein FtsW
VSRFARTDTSAIARWWRSVDFLSLIALGLLVVIGAVLTLAASPAVADRIGRESFHFAWRQLAFILPALALILAVSLLSPHGVRRLALVGFVASLGLMVLTLLIGMEVKGARRWLSLSGVSIQPSEFVKPTFAVVTAWLFARRQRGDGFPGYTLSILIYAGVVGLLALQPDVGMIVVVSGVWFAQFFLAGLPILLVLMLVAGGVGGAYLAYLSFPHVASRIDRFLDPGSGDTYQIDTALNAIRQGGLLGRGPGEGVLKRVLPDAHTDFIYAVAAEEFGLLVCLLILGLFGFIVLRGFGRVFQDSNLFVLLAGSGLLIQFGLQALINIGVNVHLLPTKGMTLPFISYGGSSVVALALGMGMMLALTRRRPAGQGITL